MKKYFSIAKHFFALNVMIGASYRASLLFWAGISIMWTVFNFFYFDVLVSVDGQIGGWNKAEIFLLISLYTILDSLTWSVFYHNMSSYTQRIFSGEMSMLLLKPINPIFIVTTEKFSISNLPRVLIGIGMLVWSVQQLAVKPTSVQIIFSFLFLLIGMLFFYTVWFMLSTLAFYFERLNNINEIMPGARRVLELPRSVFASLHPALQLFLLPLLLTTNAAAEILVGKSSLQVLLGFLAFTVSLMIFAHYWFYFSVRKYVGVAN